MTDTEIDHLQAGRELDVLVGHKLMGLRNEPKERIPNFSTDMTAAWQVLERWSLSIGPTSAPLHGDENTEWGCTDNVIDCEDRGDLLTKAPTAPLAICRMALKLAP